VKIEPTTRIGIVLLQLGGPDSLQAVEPFLFNLFSDPDIINFPLGSLLRKPLARLISKKRAPLIAGHYQKIGGRSPINEITIRQAAALENILNKTFPARVYIAMRYWKPSTSEVVDALNRENIRRVLLLPLYPQYSASTTGSGVNEWNRIVHASGTFFETEIIQDYFQHPVYIRSIVERINEALLRFPEKSRSRVHLIFSAHGTPLKLVKQGDPYKDQIEKTVTAVMTMGKYDLKYDLGFQSRVGPQEWISPFTADVVQRLGNKGAKNLLVIPVAFVSDHIETLYELNIEVREIGRKNGIEQFEVTEGLNTSPAFIEALAELVRSHIEQPSILSQ